MTAVQLGRSRQVQRGDNKRHFQRSKRRTFEPRVCSAAVILTPAAARAAVNAVSVGASSVTPSPAEGKMPAEEDPAMAPMAAVKMVKPVSVEALDRPAWKVVMHCACAVTTGVRQAGAAVVDRYCRKPNWIHLSTTLLHVLS